MGWLLSSNLGPVWKGGMNALLRHNWNGYFGECAEGLVPLA